MTPDPLLSQSYLSVSQLKPKYYILANALKIGCADRSQALSSAHESASWSTCGLCGLFYLRALGSCSGGLLFRQRLWCALILSVVRRLLRLSWLRVLQLLPELLRLRLGRLLSALVEASVSWPLVRVGRAPLARWWLAWRRMGWPSLTLSLGYDVPESFSTAPTRAARLSLQRSGVISLAKCASPSRNLNIVRTMFDPKGRNHRCPQFCRISPRIGRRFSNSTSTPAISISHRRQSSDAGDLRPRRSSANVLVAA